MGIQGKGNRWTDCIRGRVKMESLYVSRTVNIRKDIARETGFLLLSNGFPDQEICTSPLQVTGQNYTRVRSDVMKTEHWAPLQGPELGRTHRTESLGKWLKWAWKHAGKSIGPILWRAQSIEHLDGKEERETSTPGLGWPWEGGPEKNDEAVDPPCPCQASPHALKKAGRRCTFQHKPKTSS